MHKQIGDEKIVKVQCTKCSREGSLTKKQTKSKVITYEYWYVEHHIGNKIKWCYLGKYEKLPEDYKKLTKRDIQTDAQNISKSETPKFGFSIQSKHESAWARSSARIEHRAFNPGVVGSIPAGPAISLPESTRKSSSFQKTLFQHPLER